MKASEVFTLNYNYVALAAILLSALMLYYQNQKDIKYNYEHSKMVAWNNKEPLTRIQAQSRHASAYAELYKAQDEELYYDIKIAHSKINYYKRLVDYLNQQRIWGTQSITEESKINSLHSEVHSGIYKKINNYSRSNSKIIITAWSIIVFSGLFIGLSSLRFALK